MTTQAQIQGLSEFAQRGFTLEHPDDHIVELHHQGELIARFSQPGATEQSLQAECTRHLVEKHGWDSCLWHRKEVKIESNQGSERYTAAATPRKDKARD